MPRAKQYQKSGRPPLSPDKVRKQRGFRASDEEWQRWTEKSIANGFDDVTAWIRAVCDLVVVDPDSPPAEEKPNEAT